MGCRNIGKVMEKVTEKVMDIYDRKEISCEVAKELIVTAKEAVHCCDGDDDVTDAIRMCRCGRCLKKRGTEEKFYSVNDISREKIGWIDIMNSGGELLASDVLCVSCFDIVINRCFNDEKEKAGAREREYIDQCRKENKKSR